MPKRNQLIFAAQVLIIASSDIFADVSGCPKSRTQPTGISQQEPRQRTTTSHLRVSQGTGPDSMKGVTTRDHPQPQ